MSADQLLRPRLSAAAIAALNKAHAEKTNKRPTDPQTFAELAEAYMLSADYKALRPATRRSWSPWIAAAKEKFGDAPLLAMADIRMRGLIRAWRDEWSTSPRQMDYAIQVLRRILNWGVDGGYLEINRASDFDPKYKADRSEILWTDEEIESVAAKMQPHVARAFKFAAWTGLSRQDLLQLRWDQVTDWYIAKKRSKSDISQTVPVFDETRVLLEEFKMAGKTAVTVITNRRGAPFTTRGFSMAVERARKEAGVANGKTLHDLRGTFATRLMNAGFEDREIDLILGWTPGKSQKVRPFYISRKAIASSAIQRMRRYREVLAASGASDERAASEHK